MMNHSDIFGCLILVYVLYIYKASFILASKSVLAGDMISKLLICS